MISLIYPTDIKLIDYEYVGWCYRAFDISNYFNETMLDNNSPLGKGVALYY